MDLPTLGRPTSATTGTMFKASFKKSSDNGHIFCPVVKNSKTAPAPGAVFQSERPERLTRNRVQRTVFRLDQQFTISRDRLGQET
ncbi:hypothetical protein EMD78_03375 [Citrobacter portucalensis]